jgi:single-strand DNA-binding protein
MNRVELMGEVSKDPTINNINTTQKVANFHLKTVEVWASNGKESKRIEHHRIAAFGQFVEKIDGAIKAGSMIFIVGKLQTKKIPTGDSVSFSTSVILSNNSEHKVVLCSG